MHGSHFFLWPLFLLGKLPLYFSGICSAGNWHRVSFLMFHYETVNNVLRKGGELLVSSFCIFRVSCFPVSVSVIVFVAVLDGRWSGAGWSRAVAAHLHGVIKHAALALCSVDTESPGGSGSNDVCAGNAVSTKDM